MNAHTRKQFLFAVFAMVFAICAVAAENSGTPPIQPEAGLRPANDAAALNPPMTVFVYVLSGFGAYISETLKIPPSGVAIQIQNPDYRHGAMATVRSKGKNDSLTVEWFGGTDRNNSYCTDHKAELFGFNAEVSNLVSPKTENGRVVIYIRPATRETVSAEIEFFNWLSGPGCR